MQITADGSAELAITGAPFFRAIWMNEIVVNGIERAAPMAIDSLERRGELQRCLSSAVKPGSYEVKIPESSGDSQKVSISIQ